MKIQPKIVIAFGVLLLGIAGALFLLVTKSPLMSVRPGSCRIVQEKYCSQVIFIKDPRNKDITLAAFDLPKDAPIFAPADGDTYSRILTRDFPNGITTFTLYSLEKKQNEQDRSFILYGFITGDAKGGQIQRKTVGVSEELFRVSDNKLLMYGNYNLVVYVQKGIPGTKDLYLQSSLYLKKLFSQ